jgi:ribonucleoside-diphosphate reductase beta chain
MLDFDNAVACDEGPLTTTTQRKRSNSTQERQHTTIERTIFPVSSSLDPITIGAKRPQSDDIKIIGGRQYDIRQPIPIKYTEVRERFLNARHNFWTPNDIPMGEDKFQWNAGKLTEAEMWLFKTNISYLSAGDNMVPDNIIDVIMRHVTANEMRQYLRWVIGEEANHMESYLFVLESFGLDEKGQGQVFSLYQEIPALIDKVNWSLNFSSHAALSEAPMGSLAASECLLEDIFSYYIFEYLFFPLGFSQVFALARKGKLRNTAQQYSYIWRDESLHSNNGLWLIQQIIRENPQLWHANMQARFRAILDEAITLESAYAHAAMPDGGIVGMSVYTYIDFAKFLANQICKNVGLKPLFKIQSHPMPWISEYELNQEVNFFEGRVRDYKTGSNLAWD